MKRRLSVLLVAALASVLLPAESVAAHPSDLNTLTLDLILDRGGLVLIDAAANHATYEDAPSVEQREAIAGDVVDALGIPRDTAEVDSSGSLLYHEVGFTVWLHTPFANTSVPGEVQLDSRALQDVAANTVGRLKLEVCRVASPDQTLTIQANIPASAPDPAGAGSATFDRRDCASWTLEPEAGPLTVMAHTTAPSAQPVARSTRLTCGDPTSATDPTFVRTGPIALPPGVLHARATGAVSPSARLVADMFAFATSGNDVKLLVPRAWKGKMSLGARNGVRATEQVTIPTYKGSWCLVALSIWLEEPSCPAVIVKTRKEIRRVHVAIDAQCTPDPRHP